MHPTLKRIGFFSAFAVLAAFAAAFFFMPPPPPSTVTVATGRSDGVYYRYAEEYAKALAKEGIELKILPTAGSVEALKALKEGRADYAFVQGGTPAGNAQNLRGIAALYFEPLWVFVPGNSRTRPIKTRLLRDFNGSTVAVGEKGSGSHALAVTLLAANGVDAARLLPLSLEAGAGLLREGRIDALMGVVSARSPLIADILQEGGVRLLDMERARAYPKLFPYLSVVTLPRGVLDLARDLPRGDRRLVATTAQLVTTDKAHGAIVRLLLRKAREIHARDDLFYADGEFPTPKYLQFPIHEEAQRYFRYGESWLERHFPFAVATLIARMKIFLIPLLTLLLPLLKGFLPLYRWRIRHQIYRWYRQLKQIDEKADRLDPKGLERELEAIGKLQKEVQEHVSVPLSYMGEYYLLREHIRLIKEKLIALLDKRQEETI